MDTGLSGDEVEYLASCGEGIGGGVVMEVIKVKNLIKNYSCDWKVWVQKGHASGDSQSV